MAVRCVVHCHTEYSRDSSWKVADVITQCQLDKIDVIAITDHDTIAGALAVQAAAPASLQVIIGQEISTLQGDLVGLFLKKKIEPHQSIQETIKAIHLQGGLILLPHPFDRVRTQSVGRTVAEAVKTDVDLIETFNARCILSSDNCSAEQFATTHQLVTTAAADAHFGSELSNAICLIETATTPQTFLRSMRTSKTVIHKAPFSVYLRSAVAKLRKKTSLQHNVKSYIPYATAAVMAAVFWLVRFWLIQGTPLNVLLRYKMPYYYIIVSATLIALACGSIVYQLLQHRSRQQWRISLILAVVMTILFLFVRTGFIIQPLENIEAQATTPSFDFQLYCYEGTLIANGVNPYDVSDAPLQRNELFDHYSASNPPLNFLLFGSIIAMYRAGFTLAPTACSFLALNFVLFDALVGGLMVYLLHRFGRISALVAISCATIWYGLNLAPITWNVTYFEDKPFYTLLLLVVVISLYKFEQRLVTNPKQLRGIWALLLLIAITASYKYLTIPVIPLLLVFLYRYHVPLKKIITYGISMVAVYLLGLLPFAPLSFETFANRAERASVQPTHGSIFNWLPWTSFNLGGYSVTLQGLVSVLVCVAVLLGIYYKKISLTLASTIVFCVLTVVTVDGSLDRDIVGWTPLVFYLALRLPKKMAIVGLLNAGAAFTLVFLSRFQFFSITTFFYPFPQVRQTINTLIYIRNPLLVYHEELLDGLYSLFTVSILFTVIVLTWRQINNQSDQN